MITAALFTTLLFHRPQIDKRAVQTDRGAKAIPRRSCVQMGNKGKNGNKKQQGKQQKRVSTVGKSKHKLGGALGAVSASSAS